tara:strand:+ start:29 stop:451 length:423 start_codon:yes stop_codon:yes gene_type:complete
MIKYNLKCHKDHEFESWFSNSKEFDKLKKLKLLECIYCSSRNINKSIMAPMVSSSKNKNYQLEVLDKDFKYKKDTLCKLRKFIEKNFDNVGKDFSKKIREIYYDKKSNKAIYGTTTSKEREELAEEGIDLLSIPWINKDN